MTCTTTTQNNRRTYIDCHAAVARAVGTIDAFSRRLVNLSTALCLARFTVSRVVGTPSAPGVVAVTNAKDGLLRTLSWLRALLATLFPHLLFTAILQFISSIVNGVLLVRVGGVDEVMPTPNAKRVAAAMHGSVHGESAAQLFRSWHVKAFLGFLLLCRKSFGLGLSNRIRNGIKTLHNVVGKVSGRDGFDRANCSVKADEQICNRHRTDSFGIEPSRAVLQIRGEAIRKRGTHSLMASHLARLVDRVHYIVELDEERFHQCFFLRHTATAGRVLEHRNHVRMPYLLHFH